MRVGMGEEMSCVSGTLPDLGTGDGVLANQNKG
jgi:hypothetical protein